MIIYNIRHRGPYEYDKFVLNSFQYWNMIQELKKEITLKDIDKLLSINDYLTKKIENLEETDLLIALVREAVKKI